jgi:hypothetical protein
MNFVIGPELLAGGQPYVGLASLGATKQAPSSQSSSVPALEMAAEWASLRSPRP